MCLIFDFSIYRMIFFFLLFSFVIIRSVCAETSILTVYTDKNFSHSPFGVLSTETEAGFTATSGTYETLIKWSNEEKNYIPVLAKSWSVKNQREIEFHLKENIKFHDGHKLTANDVVQSYNKIKKSAQFTQSMISSVSEIKKLDEDSIIVSLSHPDSLILRKIAFFFRIYPCSRLCTPSDISSINLPGTGPWKLKTLHKNKMKFSSFVQPDTIEASPIRSELHLISGNPFKKNNKENIDAIDGLPWNQKLGAIKKFNIRPRATKSQYSDFGVFNTLSNNALIKDQNIRKAINLAINREAMQRLVYKNMAKPIASLSLPTDQGHDAKLRVYDYDLKQAQSIILAYLKKNPDDKLTLRIGMQSDSENQKRLWNFFRKSMQRIGLRAVLIKNYELSKHRDKFLNTTDIILGGDPSPYGHFEFLIKNFFAPKALFSVSRDIVISDFYKMAMNAKSENEANKYYQKIDRHIHTAYLAIPGVRYARWFAYNPLVYKPTGEFFFLDLSRLKK